MSKVKTEKTRHCSKCHRPLQQLRNTLQYFCKPCGLNTTGYDK